MSKIEWAIPMEQRSRLGERRGRKSSLPQKCLLSLHLEMLAQDTLKQ